MGLTGELKIPRLLNEHVKNILKTKVIWSLAAITKKRMINEEHIMVEAKKDYVLLCVLMGKADLVSCRRRPLALPELRGWLCSEGSRQARRTSRGQRKVEGLLGEGSSTGGRHACQQPLSAHSSAS